jgi:hypothetical protein
MLKNSGVKPARLPSRSPNLNAYAERWIGSVRREISCVIQVKLTAPKRDRPIHAGAAAGILATNAHSSSVVMVARWPLRCWQLSRATYQLTDSANPK